MRDVAREGAAQGVREALADVSSSAALKPASTTSGINESANTLAYFMTPFVNALSSPLSSNTCANCPLLEAAYQIFIETYPEDTISREKLAGGCAACVRIKNV